MIATLGVIVLGLASRHVYGLFPHALGKYPGDALWALMIFLGLGYLMPSNSIIGNALYAIVISFAVEFSQIYQEPWINAIRNTVLGHLVLGSRFGWLDLLAYTAGVSIGMIAELFSRRLYNCHCRM